MAFRGRTRSTWQPGNQEDIDDSEASSDNLSSRSPSVETVIETDDEATDQLSLKLNRLTEKLCRYESHKYFISKCLNDKLIPEGFWSLEPSIGNHEDEFLQQWYEDVTKFLLTRMEATVKFCEKTITATKSSINETENELKRKTVPTNFNEVKEEVKRNKEGYSTKLIQKKNKKYHNLKYKGNRRAGNKNNRMAIVTNHTTNMQPNLEPRPSSRRETNRRAYFNQGQGRQVANQNRTTFNFRSQPQVKPAAFTMPQKSTAFNRPHNTKSSKKRSGRPCTNRGNEHHFHEYHATVISRSSGNNRIRKVLQTKLLRKHDRRGTVVNLSSKVFSKAAFELLNKNLNFCPVPGEYNRLNLNTDLQRVFRRIKLRAHFDKPDPYHIPSESELFARRDKNWTPKSTSLCRYVYILCNQRTKGI